MIWAVRGRGCVCVRPPPPRAPPPLVSPCARSRGAEPARRPTVNLVLFFCATQLPAYLLSS